ncbi:MAG: hypothetical protein WD066_17560 [Planctomycetaceae bacterium]
MIATADTIGIGIYTPAEAAFYARVQTRLLTRWLFGSAQGDAVVTPRLLDQPPDDRLVTFLDFVQALAIRNLRINYKISLSKIRAAVDRAREQFEVEYPFAMSHTTYLFSDRARTGHGELVIQLDDGEDEPKLVQLSGKAAGNLVMAEVVELYLDQLSFDERGLAEAYRAGGDEENPIVMDPALRFGEPVLRRCGYTAETLWEASILEGGLDAAARAYGVDRTDVALACEFFDHLQGRPTA